MASAPRVPLVCQGCPFHDGAIGCQLLADLRPDNAHRFLEEGHCQPRASLAAALHRDWPWLSAHQVDELASDGVSELLILASDKGPDAVRATYGERLPNAYLFSAVQPPNGWAYRNLLRNRLRRAVRQRRREIPDERPSPGEASTSRRAGEASAPTSHPIAAERDDSLQRLYALDPRSAILIEEQLAHGDVDRVVWRQVLAHEDDVLPADYSHLVDAVRAAVERAAGRAPAVAPELEPLIEALDLSSPRGDAAVTNALTLARYKLSMLITGTLDALLERPRSPTERASARALVLRHFTPGIQSESQAYAAVKALGEDRGPFASKQEWRACYRRGAEESLAALAATEGFARAIASAETGFRRVLGLPDGRSTERTELTAGDAA